MANEKKIARYQKLFLSWLEDAATVEAQLENEVDQKKADKLQKKLKKNKDMVLHNGKIIGQEGGSLENIWDQLTERQRQIIQELFPYGTGSDNLEKQRERGYIIKYYKKDIQKVIEAEKKYPPYDPNLPVKEKLKSKRYKAEVNLGWYMYLRSKKDKSTYVPTWNYAEHFATTVEFSAEERQIIERCYQIGREYDEYNDQKFAFVVKLGEDLVEKSEEMSKWGDRTQSKVWCRNMYKKVFPDIIRRTHPERKYTSAELEQEAKAMTRRFIEFARDDAGREALLKEWRAFLDMEELSGLSQGKKEEAAMNLISEKIGVELTFFTYVYDTTESVVESMELVKKHSFEELGLA